MSQARQTEIMERELTTGWTAAKITATKQEVKTVKATPGKVARILVLDAVIEVTPTDGSSAVWDALTNAAEFNLVGTPMQFSTSIKLSFSAAGSAWILYK